MAVIRASVRDRVGLTSRQRTAEGFLRAPALLASAGVYEYEAAELGLDVALGMKPNAIVRLRKSAAELAKAAGSFAGATLTNTHPEGKVTADNWREVAVGHVEKTWSDAAGMHAALVINDAAAIADVEAGRVEMSNGYDCDIDMTPGSLDDGTAYDGQQINIQGNHAALVDVARGGPRCRLADRKPTPSTGGTMRTFVINGIKVQAEDVHADVIEREIGVIAKAKDEALARATASDAALEVAKQAKADADKAHAAEIAALKSQILSDEQKAALVTELATVAADAAKLLPEFKAEKLSAAQIRAAVLTEMAGKDEKAKAVVEKVLGGVAIDRASEAVIKTAFDLLPLTIGGAPATDAETVRAMTGADGSDDGDELTAQEQYRRNLTHPQSAGK